MENQRLQPSLSQPFQKIFVPGNVALWQHAKAQMLRAANRGVQIQMPAYWLFRPRIKILQTQLKLMGSVRFFTRGKNLPTASKHTVQVAMTITLSRRQRLRVPQNHQQPPCQRQFTAKQPGEN